MSFCFADTSLPDLLDGPSLPYADQASAMQTVPLLCYAVKYRKAFSTFELSKFNATQRFRHIYYYKNYASIFKFQISNFCFIYFCPPI